MRTTPRLAISILFGLLAAACSDDTKPKPDTGPSDLRQGVQVPDGPRVEKPKPTELGADKGPTTKAWRMVGAPEFSRGDWLSLYVYDDGGKPVPYLAFADSEDVAYNATVMSFDAASGTWKLVGSKRFTEHRADQLKLTVVKEGGKPVPYVTFQSQDLGDIRAQAMRYNGSAWEKVGGDGLSTHQSTAGAVDAATATPYLAVAVMDAVTTDLYLQVKKLSGTSWVQVGSDVKLDGGEEEWSLAVDGSVNPPALAVSMVAGKKPWVLKYDGTSSWASIGPKGFTTNEVEDLSLFLDAGQVYLAYKDPVSLKASALTYDAAAKSWKTVGKVGFSAGEIDWTTLFVTGGVPYVGYQDFAHSNYATVMSYSSATSAWAPVGVEGFSDPRGVGYPTLFVYKGVPYFGFRTAGEGITVMKYDLP